MDQALTPEQLSKLMHGLAGLPLRVVRYDEIINSNDLLTFFKPQNYFIIYYPYAQTNEGMIGHFTCMTKNGRNIYYYDPLGLKPDEYKRTSPYRDSLYRERQNSLIRHLLDKVKRGYKVDYSHYKHQSKDPNVAVCGRHCVVRCMMNHMGNDEYDASLKQLKRMFPTGSPVRQSKYMDHLIYELTKETV